MSASNKMTGREHFYTYVVPKFISLGASVVIVGALFKIMHWPFAGTLLTVGLLTEAVIFGVTAFAPVHREIAWDWSRVHPQLDPAYDGPVNQPGLQNTGVGVELDNMLKKAITPQVIESLGTGMKSLSETVSKMSGLANATVATEEYGKNVKLAANSLIEMNKSYATTVSAMSEMANASKDAKSYHDQVLTVTKNLSSLNAVYEQELQDSKKYVTAMNQYYNSLSKALESVVDASKESETFKNELSKLTTNLTNLNKVYGSMLTAMRGA